MTPRLPCRRNWRIGMRADDACDTASCFCLSDCQPDRHSPFCFRKSGVPEVSAHYVDDFNGHVTQGGFLRLQIKAGVELSLNDVPVDQIDGLALIGFGRDAFAPKADISRPPCGRQIR